jgi:hypothetical protein
MKEAKPTREEAANLLTVVMLQLRSLGSQTDNVFVAPNHPRWLLELRDDLGRTIRRHLPHEFGIDDPFYDPADNGNQGS